MTNLAPRKKQLFETQHGKTFVVGDTTDDFENSFAVSGHKKSLFHIPSNGRYSAYLWTVPANIHVVKVNVVGGGGAGQNYVSGGGITSGRGGCASTSILNSELLVTPGETIVVVVGGGGRKDLADTSDTHAAIQTTGAEEDITWEYDWYQELVDAFPAATALTQVAKPMTCGYDSLVLSAHKIVVARGGCGGNCTLANHKRYRCGASFNDSGGMLGYEGQAGQALVACVGYEDNLGGKGGSSMLHGTSLHSYLETPIRSVAAPSDPAAHPTKVATTNVSDYATVGETRLGNGGNGGTTTIYPADGGDGFVELMW